jgi:hypothetical protein
MFNKFDDKDDSYYLKYVYYPSRDAYRYVEKSQVTKNYQYSESVIDKHIKLEFTKGREYNENIVNVWYKTYPSVSEKQRSEWFRLIAMIIRFEITYGRYLKDSAAMFGEADENDKILIPREQTPVHIIEIEDETNETSSERKNEINMVDVNDKLQLNNIEKEKVILISDNDRDIYKKKYNIDYNEDNTFTVIHNLNEYFTKQLSEQNILVLFSDENIRMFANIYSDFRKRILNLYGNIDRKN